MNTEDIIINIIKRNELFASNENDKVIKNDAFNNEINSLLQEKNKLFKMAYFANKMMFVLGAAGIIAGAAGVYSYNYYVNELSNYFGTICFGLTTVGSGAGLIKCLSLKKEKMKEIKKIQDQVEEKVKEKENVKSEKHEVNARINTLKSYLSSITNQTIMNVIHQPLNLMTCKKVYSLLLNDNVAFDVIIYSIGHDEVERLSSLLEDYENSQNTNSDAVVEKRKELLLYKNNAQNFMDNLSKKLEPKSSDNVADEIFKRLNS